MGEHDEVLFGELFERRLSTSLWERDASSRRTYPPTNPMGVQSEDYAAEDDHVDELDNRLSEKPFEDNSVGIEEELTTEYPVLLNRQINSVDSDAKEAGDEVENSLGEKPPEGKPEGGEELTTEYPALIDRSMNSIDNEGKVAEETPSEGDVIPESSELSNIQSRPEDKSTDETTDTTQSSWWAFLKRYVQTGQSDRLEMESLFHDYDAAWYPTRLGFTTGKHSLWLATVAEEAERERCGENSDMFGVLTSGVHYMCVEQGKAFNATIGCIDREAHAVKSNANSFRDFLEVTDQACVCGTQGFRYAECALSCFRTRFNKRCEGNAGSMISETIVRPLVEGHQKFSPLFIALGVVAPRSCSFLYKGSRLLRHRIDPKTNEELWKTYGVAEEEELAAAAEESANGANPFVPNAINADSDLDRLSKLHFISFIWNW
ncbi:unnamed protein product [Nippostrongylus brasiliensis]|uniref:CPG4 domain-containing protein n=1 Tax=Nippostrongylus brasiliensis TaxID=27835 RepID=A0A0N4YN51_NIPBR|nr:unnamed protein product [Nippostrongylus brasiliensis]